ncbi:MAG: hypothetical protein M3Q69_12110 [Acidobacteriota bacterium]|nr:hypothetical protein [Acidobacteriota bacterium]
MRLLRALAASIVLALPLAAADSVVTAHQSFAQPALGSAQNVENLTFTSGHLRVTLVQGTAAPVKAGNETIGLFFSGKGQLEYISPDPAEAAVLTTNAKRATKLKAEKVENGLAVRDTFSDLFLHTAGQALPALTGAAATTDVAPAFAAHRELFDREINATSFDFIKQKFDAPSKAVVRAEFRGGKETVVYTYDSIATKRETLYVLQAIPSLTNRDYKNAIFPIELSSLPIGVSRKDFLEPPYILTDLDYTLTASDKSDAALHIVETIVPRGGAQRVFRFRQTSVSYDSNEKPHHYNVKKVTLDGGVELPFVHDSDELLVSLPAAAPADKPFRIVFDIDGDFLIRPSGNSYWMLAGEPWFPQPDLNGQYYRVHSLVKVKKPFVPLMPGQTITRREEGEYNVVENRIDKPVQYLVALAGKYTWEEETRNGLTIRVASYGLKNQRAIKQLTNLAYSMIALYEQFLGPFPFSEYNIIEINDVGYGVAPPATMFITSEAFSPTGDWVTQIFSQGVNHRFAHEIAHQYWGHAVKVSSAEDNWLSEAFAEYTSSFAVKQMNRGDAMMRAWRANANEANEQSSIATANMLRNYNDDSAYWMRTYLVYDKGAYLLWRIHQDLGDKFFLTFLRTLQGTNAWRFVATKDLAPMLKRISGRDYTQFFEENYWGTGMPK